MPIVKRGFRPQEPGRGPKGETVTTTTVRPYQFGDAPITSGGSQPMGIVSTGTQSVPFNIGTAATQSAVSQAAGPTGPVFTASSYMDPAAIAAAAAEGFTITGPTFGGSGTSTGGLTAQQKIDNALKATALRTSQFGTQQAAQDILNRLKTAGQIPTSIAEVIANATTGQTDYVNKQFGNLMQLLQQQYGRAQDTTTAGYDALRNYLTQNVPTAYASALEAARTAPAQVAVNDLAQYMRGQGVSEAGAQPGLLAAQAAAQGGAANYQNLLNVLAAQEAKAQESRLAEEQMARALAGTNLGALLAQQQGVLTSSQLQALAQVQAQDAAARLRAQEQATAREQALQDAMNTLIQSGYVTPTGEAPVIPETPVPASPIQKLAALPITQNAQLKKDVNKFVAANPNATIAQIEKKFPRLAANIR
jgi:hypothetical protein